MLGVSSEEVDDFFEVGDDGFVSLNESFDVGYFEALGFDGDLWKVFDSFLEHIFVADHKRADFERKYKGCGRVF